MGNKYANAKFHSEVPQLGDINEVVAEIVQAIADRKFGARLLKKSKQRKRRMAA